MDSAQTNPCFIITGEVSKVRRGLGCSAMWIMKDLGTKIGVGFEW